MCQELFQFCFIDSFCSIYRLDDGYFSWAALFMALKNWVNIIQKDIFIYSTIHLRVIEFFFIETLKEYDAPLRKAAIEKATREHHHHVEELKKLNEGYLQF